MKILKFKHLMICFIFSFTFLLLINSVILSISNGKSTYDLPLSVMVTSLFENKTLTSINNFNHWANITEGGYNKLKIDNIQIFNILNHEVFSKDIIASTDYANVFKVLQSPFISANNQSTIGVKLINSLILSVVIATLISMLFSIFKLILAKVVAFRGTIPEINTNNHLLALNFFRFIAAILVVVYHMAPKNWHTEYWITNLGSEMVTFFFVLSGFVMIVSHYNRNSESVFEFYRLRFARIYPIYLVVVLLLINSHTNIIDVFLSVFMLQSFVPGHSIAINVPGWSLSVEAFFYLIFPLLLIFYRKISIAKVSFIVILSFGFAFCLFKFFFKIFDHNSEHYHELLNYFPLVHLCSFILGNYIGLIYLKCRNYTPSNIMSNIISLTAVLWVVYDLKHSYSANVYGLEYLNWSTIVYSFSFALLIIGFAMCKNSFLTKLLQNRICIRLGDLSYSIYLLQSIAYGKIVNQLLLFSDSDVIKLIVPLFLLIGMSFFTYTYIEVPMKKFLMKK